VIERVGPTKALDITLGDDCAARSATRLDTLRGTRANLKDPYSKYTYFQIGDDKLSKKVDDALRFRTVPHP
jgi:hypothetical protein